MRGYTGKMARNSNPMFAELFEIVEPVSIKPLTTLDTAILKHTTLTMATNIRPNCINYGCNEPATFSRTNKDGSKRWRVHCYHCQKASYGLIEHRENVTPFKTGICSNKDSHLGFKCPTSYAKGSAAIGITEVDHKDGDHTNWKHSNLDELCPICHKRKGILNGDHNGQKNK